MPFCELRYFSNALGKHTACNVLLPDGEGPFHVMFLLHGLSDDYSAWMRRSSIERYLDGVPLIVVMPDGGRGFYCDATEGSAYATAIGEELIGLIRRTFKTQGPWATAGLSMGGYGAIRIALDHPEVFRSAVALSAAVNFGHNAMLADDDRAKEFARIVGREPAGSVNDLYSRVLKTPKDQLPALRIDCGTEDFLIEDNRAFRRHLEANGIPHEYEEHPGAHDWAYWDEHVQSAIAFNRRALGF